jgi:transportin-1
LGAFKKICEDHSFKVETCPGNPLSILLPKFIGLMDSPTVSVRVNAIYCVNSFIRPDCQEFHANLQSFMSSLSKRADCDTDAEVRKAVCKSLVSLMESFKNQIAQSLPYIYEYVLKATTDEDLSVSLEACEFWLALSEMEDLTQSVVALYPR